MEHSFTVFFLLVWYCSSFCRKVRIVPDLKKGHKLRMWKELAIEEENIVYISKPYLTTAEEKHLPTYVTIV